MYNYLPAYPCCWRWTTSAAHDVESEGRNSGIIGPHAVWDGFPSSSDRKSREHFVCSERLMIWRRERERVGRKITLTRNYRHSDWMPEIMFIIVWQMPLQALRIMWLTLQIFSLHLPNLYQIMWEIMLLGLLRIKWTRPSTLEILKGAQNQFEIQKKTWSK